MKKKGILLGILATGALFTLASCGNSEELENLKKEVASLKDENSSLKEDKESLSNKNETLTNDNKRLSNEKADEIAAKNKALDQNEKLTKDKEDALSSYADLKKDYEALEEGYESLVDENGTLKEDIHTYLKANNLCAIKYTDPIGKSSIKTVSASINLSTELVNNYNAVINNGYISSLKNYVDSNWYVAVYENGEYASVGVDGLVVDAGDVFEFKQECWNTVDSIYGNGQLDSYDVLVDKILFNYYENTLPKKLASVDTYTGITYWDSMALYRLKNAKKYGEYAYKYSSLINNPFSYNFVTGLSSVNQSELAGNDLFKYYYADRLVAYNRDYTDLKTKYQSYLDTLTSYPAYGEYNVPFHTGVAKTLGLNLNDAIKNTTYRAELTYGPEGLAWELTGLACYNTLTKDDLSGLTIAALDNEYVGSKDVALSTYILAYAASNLNFRELKDSNGIDALRLLLNYYDQETLQFSTEKLSNDMSSNQIYAALVAYKIQRDTNEAQNLFE